MTAVDTRPLPPVPTFPFSMFDPVHLGRDEYGQPVYVNLAERNMLVMNTLGMNVMILPTDLPGERSWKVVAPTEPLRPFAESVIRGYLELISPTHNNLRRYRFIDRPEASDVAEV